ncbi:DUF4861 family protein [Chitinophaga pinensis]|uniref:DUF4861 domain-containing protein n=1 Tax=Chitinophaga pinensis (strain ATCC 43595 / DSM 2588 / LMG 13176 / NBRC 15968 / NCIMB 11800 / UQM 2034) TaxID=485918 RepID=A0A979GBE5_CHIPD|nr:DUF4861 family protein [Chitinophaga pinensis]ACU64227.1 hypothetical protein Cpin_6826 [Chitinophaga pinensis DSM 2588]
MKRILLLLMAAGGWHSVLLANSTGNGKAAPVSITIKNTSAISRMEEIVEIPYTNLGRLTGAFKLVNKQTGKEVPYQIAYEGSPQPQLLLVQVSVPAHKSVIISAVAGQPAVVKPRTYARYVPERKDDFAWENDCIAFRMYGAALENFPAENAHGIDVWTKRTPDLVLNRWYKTNDYHHDNGQGLDYYHVGMTLGGGDIAPYLHDSLYFPKNYRTWKVLDSGPLRCTFQLGYEPWQVDGKTVAVVKTISLDAGAQLNKMSVLYTLQQGDSLSVAAGIVKRADPGTLLLDEKTGVLGYWEPEHGADGITGLGLVVPVQKGHMKVTDQHLLATAKASGKASFVYYFGAAWNKAGYYTSAAAWFAYLQTFAAKQASPLEININ